MWRKNIEGRISTAPDGMAVSCVHLLHSTVAKTFPSLPTNLRTHHFFRNPISCSSSSFMDPHLCKATPKFMDFPHASAPQRDLMIQLVSAVEARLDSALQPCTLPPDVQYFKNPNGSAHGCLHVRPGFPSSKIDFILGSWAHCKLPTGGALNITTLWAFLRSSTDAPNFLIEILQSSPESLILILDLPPRKDLVLNSEYLKVFYEDTQLDRHRQQLFDKLPEVSPYISSSLYFRSFISPSAIVVRIEAKAEQTARIEEIIQDHVSPVAKEMLETWISMCACGEREVGEDEGAVLPRRDKIMKDKTIELEIGSNFPRIFGQEVGNRIVEVLLEIYNA